MQNGGSMLESKILPTILIILPSSVFLLLAHPGAGKAAAEKCNTRPSSSAPQGTHWYYRVNRTDNRRCWYLSSAGIKVLSHARGTMSDAASPSPAPKPANASETARATPPQTTSAQIASVQMAPAQATAADPAFSETRVHEHATAMGLTARWPDLPESPNLDASELAAVSNSYADPQTTADAEEQMPLTSPVTEAGRAGQAAFGSVFLAGALALGSLSLVGGVFSLARRSRQRYLRDPWRTAAGWSGPQPHMRADFSELAGSSSVGARHGASTLRVPQPTDPAHDLKTSLTELMRDLQRARGANYWPRSFAPPLHQMRKSTDKNRQVSFNANSRFAPREGIVPAPELNHTELATDASRFKEQPKARTVPFNLSERVASVLGVESSLAVAQAAEEGAAR